MAADPAVAQRIVQAASGGALTLVVTFHLPEDGEDASCAHPNGSTRYTLGIEPYAWEYREGDQVLARGGAGGEKPLVTVTSGAIPSVAVASPPVAGGDGLRQAAEARRGDLEGCYRRALQRDPGLDGSVVADLDLAAGGQPRSVRVAADSVQDEAMVSCVHDVLAATRFPSGGRAQIPIEFSLRPPPGAPR